MYFTQSNSTPKAATKGKSCSTNATVSLFPIGKSPAKEKPKNFLAINSEKTPVIKVVKKTAANVNK